MYALLHHIMSLQWPNRLITIHIESTAIVVARNELNGIAACSYTSFKLKGVNIGKHCAYAISHQNRKQKLLAKA